MPLEDLTQRLRATALAALLLLGACAGTAGSPSDTPPPTPTGTPTGTPDAGRPTADVEAEIDVAPARLVHARAADYDALAERRLPRDAFPVLDDPPMAPAGAADVDDDEPVIGVVCDGEARAYPVAVMGRHELVNDTCGETPITASW